MNGDSAPVEEASIEDATRIAVLLHQRGEYEAAATLYERVLAIWPDCPDALHFSGLIELQKGNRARAIELIERSLEVVPQHPDFWNNYGNALKAVGRRDDATAAYRRSLELRPRSADTHNNLGVMASQRGDWAAAADYYREAIALEPAHAAAHLNLGSALAHLDMLDDAVREYDLVTQLRPGDPEAYGRLGLVYWRQRKLREATEAIVRNTKMAPGDHMAFVILAGIFYEQGLIDESVDAYRKAVEIEPQNGYAQRLLGMTLCLHGRAAEAREVWTKWAEADPANPVPRHLLKAGADGAVPDRATDEFVVRVFDGFAATFDNKLKELEYRAPQLASDALRHAVGEPAATLDILDAGCGTGLCAPLLRPFARRLDGVDLSPGMLAKAEARGGYDSLTAAELTEFMAGRDAEYDAILSADTLCYFGKLDGVFAAAARALRPGGHFIFTVEKTPEAAGAERCTLDFSGRFTHTEDYVRTALAEAGLAVGHITTATLRLEYFKPVAGLVVVARRDPRAG